MAIDHAILTMLKRTAIISLVVFWASLVWLNFGFVKSEFALITNRVPSPNLEENRENINEPVSLFPISSNFIGSRIEKPKPQNTQSAQPRLTIADSIQAASLKLSIPSLGIQAPIILEPTIDENKIYKKLESGVVHYGTTPLPGESGTSIVLGHSSAYPWYRGNYGSIFSQISKLKTGDMISIGKDGQILNYRVSRSIVFSPKTDNDFELRELETTTGSSLVLMTCWPTGTNAKRIAVRADLI